MYKYEKYFVCVRTCVRACACVNVCRRYRYSFNFFAQI